MKSHIIINKGQLDLYTIFISSRWFESIEDFINLELTIPRMNGNMTKFHYNPISITKKTREFFPYLQTLYLYDKSDEILNFFTVESANSTIITSGIPVKTIIHTK